MGEAEEADEGEMGTSKDTAPVARQAVCRQTLEIGAVCINVHVRICAGGAGKLAFLPQPTQTYPKPPLPVFDATALRRGGLLEGCLAGSHGVWVRVLETFSGTANDSSVMTPTEAEGYVNRGWRRWEPVLEALECLEQQALDTE